MKKWLLALVLISSTALADVRVPGAVGRIFVCDPPAGGLTCFYVTTKGEIIRSVRDLGWNATPQIDFCMDNYQFSKRAYRASASADDRLDMEYWETRLIAAKAIALIAAAIPSPFLQLGIDQEAYLQRAEDFTERAINMEVFFGLPRSEPIYTEYID